MTTKHTEGLPGSAQTDMESKRDELAENYSAATHPHGHSFCQVFDAVTAIHREEIAELQRKLDLAVEALQKHADLWLAHGCDSSDCSLCYSHEYVKTNEVLEKLREGKSLTKETT